MASSGKVGAHTGHCSARQAGVRAFREHTQGDGEMLHPGPAGGSRCRVGIGRAQSEDGSSGKAFGAEGTAAADVWSRDRGLNREGGVWKGGRTPAVNATRKPVGYEGTAGALRAEEGVYLQHFSW